MHRFADPADVVVGWRSWKLSKEGLSSWAVAYTWRPGPNRAACCRPTSPLLAPTPCASPPGPGCRCGLWALWELASCVDRIRRAADSWLGAIPVIGLVAGWGEVAIHGDEGFRAERASILLLIEEPVWAEVFDPLWSGWRRLGRVGRRLSRPGLDRRRRLLRQVALRYGVPVLRLAQAARGGVLGEFGIPPRQLREIESLVGDPGA
ncbi:MAG TPA: hypothetical protein VFD01_18315 [Candidatus Dormibacteraeota bacterium]|nr:hypothetical protein [Candidatus Dormibacteraeota bacterium]